MHIKVAESLQQKWQEDYKMGKAKDHLEKADK
jgi:hypothetical protein